MSRSTDSNSGASMGVINSMLKAMTNISDVLIIAATNCPWLLDEAFRRRLSCQIYVKLPNERERFEMIDYFLNKRRNFVTQDEKKFLAQKTENYSGADLELLIQQALNFATRRTLSCSYARISGATYYPCSKEDTCAVKLTPRLRSSLSPQMSPIFLVDITAALKICRPTSDPLNVSKLNDYAASFNKT